MVWPTPRSTRCPSRTCQPLARAATRGPAVARDSRWPCSSPCPRPRAGRPRSRSAAPERRAAATRQASLASNPRRDEDPDPPGPRSAARRAAARPYAPRSARSSTVVGRGLPRRHLPAQQRSRRPSRASPDGAEHGPAPTRRCSRTRPGPRASTRSTPPRTHGLPRHPRHAGHAARSVTAHVLLRFDSTGEQDRHHDRARTPVPHAQAGCVAHLRLRRLRREADR